MSSSLIVTITGASGRIAYSLLPILCHGDAFGNKTLELRLLDIHHCQKKLEGVKLELDDSAYPLVDKVVTTIDPAVAFQDADVAILLGGFPRKPGMQRSDLIAQNAAIMKEHGEAIEKYASRNIKVLVIANPANTNCAIASHYAPSIPQYNFTCLTRLDHDRLIGMVVNKLNSLNTTQSVINPSHVRDVVVFGNHSTTQVPYIDSATVHVDNQWKTVRSLIDSEWIDNVLPGMIQNRGAEIIHYLEASSAMSAARAIIRHLHDWIGPAVSPSHHRTGEHGEVISPIFSMGVFSQPGNSYDVPEGIVFSFPCRRVLGSHSHHHDSRSHSHHRNEVHAFQDYEIVENLPLSDSQKHAIGLSIDELLLEKSLSTHKVADTVTAKVELELKI